MSIRSLFTILVVAALGAAAFAVGSASTATPELSGLLNDEDQRAATEHSRRSLSDLIAQGRGESRIRAEIVFLEPLPIDDVHPLVNEYHLSVKQLKARFPGFDQTLSAGYVVQPGQSLDDALAAFVSYQEPYMREMIMQLNKVVDDPTIAAEERQAQNRQLADMSAFHQSLDRDGVRLSSIITEGTAANLEHLLDEASGKAIVAVSGGVSD